MQFIIDIPITPENLAKEVFDRWYINMPITECIKFYIINHPDDVLISEPNREFIVTYAKKMHDLKFN